MIVITYRNGHNCPEFICDCCRERLGPEDWVYWRVPSEEGHSGNVICLHDSQCVRAAEPYTEYQAMSVKDYLYYLCTNLGFFPTELYIPETQ